MTAALIGGVFSPSTMGVTGGWSWGAAAVLAEEVETPTIKSYPEEFAKALSPITTVRGTGGDAGL